MDYKKLYMNLLKIINDKIVIFDDIYKSQRENENNRTRLFELEDILNMHQKILIEELTKEN